MRREPTLAAIKTGATRKASKFVRSIVDGGECSNGPIDGVHQLANLKSKVEEKNDEGGKLRALDCHYHYLLYFTGRRAAPVPKPPHTCAPGLRHCPSCITVRHSPTRSRAGGRQVGKVLHDAERRTKPLWSSGQPAVIESPCRGSRLSPACFAATASISSGGALSLRAHRWCVRKGSWSAPCSPRCHSKLYPIHRSASWSHPRISVSSAVGGLLQKH